MKATIVIVTTVEGGPPVELKRLTVQVPGQGPITTMVDGQAATMGNGGILRVELDIHQVS